jgi:hypothetical protein
VPFKTTPFWGFALFCFEIVDVTTPFHLKGNGAKNVLESKSAFNL